MTKKKKPRASIRLLFLAAVGAAAAVHTRWCMTYCDEALAYTHTRSHNNGSGTLAHDKSSRSFFWKSGIHLSQCIRHLPHYPCVIAASASLPRPYALVFCAFVYLGQSLCALVWSSALQTVCARPDRALSVGARLRDTSISDCPLISSLFTDASSHSRTVNNAQWSSYYPSRECFSLRQLVCLLNWLLSLLRSCHDSSGAGPDRQLENGAEYIIGGRQAAAQTGGKGGDTLGR